MKKLIQPNHYTYKKLEQVQKAVIECNSLGLEVQEIEFNRIKPRIKVRDTAATIRLENTGRAIEYGYFNKEKGRYRLMQIMAAGIKVIWETRQHH